MNDWPKSNLTPADEMVYALDQGLSEINTQIGQLAQVLVDEFGGPVTDESACEMAIRLLRDQKATIARAAHLLAQETKTANLARSWELDADRLARVAEQFLIGKAGDSTKTLRARAGLAAAVGDHKTMKEYHASKPREEPCQS